jgi:hypothetical protein
VKAADDKKTGCGLCWLDGVWSEPVKGWDGFPICREHLSESLAKDLPSVPPATVFTAPMTLQ